MFTGIIEHVGTVRSVQRRSGGMLLGIDLGPLSEGVGAGDSIAVNGVCLTVRAPVSAPALFDVSEESLTRSGLGTLRVGMRVNLERAMRADGRFGGHFVQGHIDGTGRITSIRKQADFAEFRIETEAKLLTEIVEKGSVAVDGISLTVASMDTTGFTLALIPTTLQETTWRDAKVGDQVNIETDIVIKTINQRIGPLWNSGIRSKLDSYKQMGY